MRFLLPFLIIILNVWTSVRAKLQQNRVAAYWHSLFTDPRSAVLLYYCDDNIVAQQQKLQVLRQKGTSYTSSILFFMREICQAGNNEILFSHIRTVLEIFILYSIETSDLRWLTDNRTACLSRDIETLSSIGFQNPPPLPIADDPLSIRHCLRVSIRLKLFSRVEQCQADIIQALIGLSETMSLDGALPTYNPGDPRHQRNCATFKKRLRSTDYYWISMAYCLAIEL